MNLFGIEGARYIKGDNREPKNYKTVDILKSEFISFDELLLERIIYLSMVIRNRDKCANAPSDLSLYAELIEIIKLYQDKVVKKSLNLINEQED